jgi:sensor histidine kinase YesM
MIKDLFLKVIFVPLLGIALPIISGLISYDEYTVPELIGANIFFILTSLCIWLGCNWIHTKLRPLYAPLSNPLTKIAAVSIVSLLYGTAISGLSSLVWLKISRELFSWIAVYKFLLACLAAIIVFTLIYEILFLNKERELDTKVVDLLDKERTQAELQALTNEMDPHFIFNSLNTLNYLIVHDAEQAHLFNNRLALVYKYFLLNKNRELIPLMDELEFIQNYFYLLQIRHDNKLKLEIELNENSKKALIPPCALQLLVENAIKHNEYSEQHPLVIRIYMNDETVKVSNRIKPKTYEVNSTGIGLKNLSARYKILFNKNILIENAQRNFSVKLPLIIQP